MKKLLAILGVSVALLAGLLIYTGIVSKEDIKEKAAEIVTELPEVVEIKPAVTPIPTRPPVTPAPNEELVVTEEEVTIEDDEELEKEDTFEVTVPTHDQYSYAYGTLTDSEKELYDIIYAATVSYQEGVTVPTLDTNAIDKVFNCVMIDHPEIFYVNGYRYTRYTRGDELKKLTYTASYSYSRSETDRISKELDAAVNNITANIYPAASDYLKIKYLYDLIIKNTDYDLNSSDNQNIISVLLNHRSVCQGYAKTMQLLLNKVGVPCTLITGTVNTGERHAWNAIKADGEWYYTDVTWGDASYKLEDASQVDFAPEINYDYLMVTSGEIGKTHFSDAPMPIPQASSLTDNYYVQEGLYLMTYDPNQLKMIFDYRASLGEPTVTLKCADANVYNVVRAEMLDNQKIFDYVKTGQVRYYENPELTKLVFALR